MNSENELERFINDNIKLELSSDTVGNMKYRANHYTNVPMENKYDRLSINEYLVFYKINRLEALGVISHTTKIELTELYNAYLQVNERIGKEVYMQLIREDYLSDLLEDLHKQAQQLRQKLLEYNLGDGVFDLQQMIDSQIISENGLSRKLTK